jgi:hypothetical protein
MSFGGRSPRVRRDRLRRILPARGDDGTAKAPSKEEAFSTCPQCIEGAGIIIPFLNTQILIPFLKPQILNHEGRAFKA